MRRIFTRFYNYNLFTISYISIWKWKTSKIINKLYKYKESKHKGVHYNGNEWDYTAENTEDSQMSPPNNLYTPEIKIER